MRIDWTSGPAPGIAGRGRKQVSGFSLPDVAPGPDAPGETHAAAPVSAPMLQQAGTPPDAARSDKEAAGHGEAVLAALADVQMAALDGGGGSGLGRLADLAGQRPRAADPRLQEVLDAVAVRAAVELARAES